MEIYGWINNNCLFVEHNSSHNLGKWICMGSLNTWSYTSSYNAISDIFHSKYNKCICQKI